MPAVLYDVDGPVATVTLNRPERRNAVDRVVADELLAALREFDADDSLSVAVLAGAGDDFCAGADLTTLDDRDRMLDIDPDGSGPLGPTRVAWSKPIIAAVQGHAVAGGLELALMCDLRVADQTAVFGVYCRRWGVPLVDGGTVRLPRIVGQARALDMIMTGRPVSADEALSIGLANRLARRGEALSVAQSLAAQIAAFPQECLRADRDSALRQWDLPFGEALRLEGAEGIARSMAEAQDGAARFVAGEGRHGAF